MLRRSYTRIRSCLAALFCSCCHVTLHVKGVFLKCSTKFEGIKLHIHDHIGIGVGYLNLFRCVITFVQPDLLSDECMCIIIGSYIKNIALLLIRKLTGCIPRNAPNQCFIEIYLSLIIWPIALKTEAFVLARCQNKHAFIVTQYNLCYILFCIR
ncbi:hypothetical protein D1872_284620 [compost metagenome]